MEEYYSLLSASDLFYGLTSEELGSMLHCLGAKIVDTQKGDPVFLEGDPAGFVGIVLEGSVQALGGLVQQEDVRLQQQDFCQRRPLLLAPGQVVGMAIQKIP